MNGKNIVLGITGSIAAYKSAELARQLKKEGATVKVVMTKNATRFVDPFTFETLNKKETYEVFFHLWQKSHEKEE